MSRSIGLLPRRSSLPHLSSVQPSILKPVIEQPGQISFGFREQREGTLMIVQYVTSNDGRDIRRFDVAELHDQHTTTPFLHFRNPAGRLVSLEKLIDLVRSIVGAPDSDDADRCCAICGCTEENCRQCIKRTGRPCHWVARRLCSACTEGPSTQLRTGGGQ